MLLVDASVWVAAVTPQHPQHVQARNFLGRGGPITVLDLTLYEVADVIARRYGQPQEARKLIHVLLTAAADSLQRVDATLLEDGMDLMVDHSLTSYDVAYVAAARRHGWQLVSLDVRDLVSKGLAVTPDKALYP
ncbi:MAG: type II toxin-antitoxin system VapC family toxin [Solirubrobacterales bacterium]